jgi:CheY-like chemotaxis protein
MKLLVLVVDDEPDVELLFRQQFRHDLRAGRFNMEFAQSGEMALQRIADATGVLRLRKEDELPRLICPFEFYQWAA